MAAAGAVLARAYGHPAIARAAAAALFVAALAGCGSSHRTSSSGADGRGIYDRDCASCHTLTGREHGAIGGDLVIAARHLDASAVASFARVMPVRPRLDARAAAAVARYIESRTR